MCTSLESYKFSVCKDDATLLSQGALFTVFSHTFIFFWLQKTSVSVKMYQLTFRVLFWFIWAFHPEISSFFGKNFLFLFLFSCFLCLLSQHSITRIRLTACDLLFIIWNYVLVNIHMTSILIWREKDNVIQFLFICLLFSEHEFVLWIKFK